MEPTKPHLHKHPTAKATTDDTAPAAPVADWTVALEPRERTHVEFCRDYVGKFNHGAPGHLDYQVIARLAMLLDQVHGVPVTPTESE